MLIGIVCSVPPVSCHTRRWNDAHLHFRKYMAHASPAAAWAVALTASLQLEHLPLLSIRSCCRMGMTAPSRVWNCRLSPSPSCAQHSDHERGKAYMWVCVPLVSTGKLQSGCLTTLAAVESASPETYLNLINPTRKNSPIQHTRLKTHRDVRNIPPADTHLHSPHRSPSPSHPLLAILRRIRMRPHLPSPRIRLQLGRPLELPHTFLAAMRQRRVERRHALCRGHRLRTGWADERYANIGRG